MTRITIVGATGKMGRILREEVAVASDLILAEAISSQGDAGSIALSDATFTEADVIVDFSTPIATLELLDRLAGRPVPLVIGTTGFTDAQMERLMVEGARRPILIGANLTKGFEAFAAAGMALAGALPDAALTVREVYNAAKKPVASGTTNRLRNDLGTGGRPVDVEVERVGDTPGINAIILDYGVATIELRLTVHTRAAYARGGLDAARWLVGRPNGVYRPGQILTD